MTPLAHVGGLPVEELLPPLAACAGILLLRARVALSGRRRRGTRA